MTDTPQGHPAEVVETSTAPQGSQPEVKWYETLPEDLRTDSDLKIYSKYDSVESALRALPQATRLVGKRIQDASPDELKRIITPEEVYDIAHTRGLPKSLEEYKFADPIENRLTPELAKIVKEKALEYKLNPDQMGDLIAMQESLGTKIQDEQRASWIAASQSRFGKNLDETLELASRTIRDYGGDEVPQIKEFLNQTGYGNHPVVINLLANIGRSMAEDKVPNSVSTAKSDELIELTNKIHTLLNDRKFRSNLGNGDNKAAAQLDALYARQIELSSN